MRLRAILVLLMITGILTGCIGSTQAPHVQMTLWDLYICSTGTYIHYGVGQYMADQLRGMGAISAGYNVRAPYSRKEADVVAIFYNPAGRTKPPIREVYEIKPISYHLVSSRTDDARAQLREYVDLFRRTDLVDNRMSRAGGHFTAPLPKGKPVPGRYLPAMTRHNIEVVIFTADAAAPGVVFYYYRWKDRSKRPTASQLNARLVNLIHDVAKDVRIKDMSGPAHLRLRVAQTYADDDISTTRDVLFNIHPVGGTADARPDMSGLEPGKVKDGLMPRLIPDWMYKNVPLPWPVPGADKGQSWYCETRYCA